MPGTAHDKLIVALDRPSADEALRLADSLRGVISWVKVGLELFTAAGPSVVDELQSRGFRVFLDLKLYDIPNTVAGAVRAASATGAELLTIHASGGPAMLRAAQQAAGPQLQLLAVTVLTSMDAAQLAACGVQRPVGDQVSALAELAWDAGIRGMVCSPEELASLRGTLGEEAMLVTPGIRPAGVSLGDQKRVATPAAAMAAGASRIVVGRPITDATDPVMAAKAILAEMELG